MRGLQISNLVIAFLTGAFIFLSGSSVRAEMADYPAVKLQALDKITARTQTFEAEVGKTVRYGPIYIKVQTCRKSPPIEQPESAAFLQIWEVTPDGNSEWVFSGWMFASSPALSSMDHPIYDVWVLDCVGDIKDAQEMDEEESEENKGEEAENSAADKNNAPGNTGATEETDQDQEKSGDN